MKRALERWRLVGVAVLLFVFLGGPSPGNVGSCDEESQFADPVEFCNEREAWKCARMRARGEITPENETACINAASVMCSGLSWPLDCQPPPSKLATQNCINALMNPATLSMGDDLPECRIPNLCAASM